MTIVESSHPEASVTIISYVPAEYPNPKLFPVPTTCDPLILTLYGAIPPVISNYNSPSFPPLHETFITESITTNSNG